MCVGRLIPFQLLSEIGSIEIFRLVLGDLGLRLEHALGERGFQALEVVGTFYPEEVARNVVVLRTRISDEVDS